MSLVTKEINRRRHIRWKIEKRCELLIPDSDPVQCIIYDFCSGGLFLGFEQPGNSIKLQPQQHVNVCFSVNDHGNRTDYQFDVEIMRVCSNGIGVAFQHIPMSAFQALVKEANLDTVPVSLDGLSVFPDQINKKKLEKSFKKMLRRCLPLILKEFFSKIDTELSYLSRDTERSTGKRIYINTFRRLIYNRKSIVYKFCNSILNEINFLDNSMIAEKGGNFDNDSNDAIANNDEMGDWVDLSSVIRRLESKFEKKLNLQEQKLNQITGIPICHINNPLSPAKLFYSFRDTIDNPGDNNEIRKTLYDFFEHVLTNYLSNLYLQFDTVLIDQVTAQKKRLKTETSDKLRKTEISPEQQPPVRNQQTKRTENCDEQIEVAALSDS